jgi:ketosteroid isomerase-like protein
MKLKVRRVVTAGDLALMISDWSLTGKGPEGQPVQMAGRASDVLRRQRDGTWRAVIDNPLGTA